LAAVAARQREIGGAISTASGEISNQLRVFVVGMGRNVEDAAEFIEAAKVLQDGWAGFGSAYVVSQTDHNACANCNKV
jgi:hypothetical protein